MSLYTKSDSELRELSSLYKHKLYEVQREIDRRRSSSGTTHQWGSFSCEKW